MGIPTLPARAELYSSASECTGVGICSSNGYTQLAAYDEMLLKRTSDELKEMSEGASEAQLAVYDECQRLVALLLNLDWKGLDATVKKLDPSKSSTKKLATGVQKKDPKLSAKAVLELADD